MMRQKICFGNNSLPDIVTVIVPPKFLITSTNPYFKNFHWKKIILKIIYVDLRYSLGYPSEVEKPSRNDSKLTLTIELKSALPKKNDAQSLKIYSQRVSCR